MPNTASGHVLSLPPEALEQLRSILDSYDQLSANSGEPNAGGDAEIAALRTALQENPQSLWWADIAQAELCVVAVLDEDQTRARLSGWRRRMHEVIGDARYALYLTGAANLSSATAGIGALKADLSECIRATYYFYGAYGVSSRSRSEVTKATLQVAASILAIEMLLALVLTWHVRPGTSAFGIPQDVLATLYFILATSAAAIAGSIISVQRRLQDPSVDVDPFYRYIQTKADRFGVAFVSPLFGAIFGLVMYALLASKLISSTVIHFNDRAQPAAAADVAATLIFGFLAGFAEQVVPDALTRLAARTLGGMAGLVPPAPAPAPAPPPPAPVVPPQAPGAPR